MALNLLETIYRNASTRGSQETLSSRYSTVHLRGKPVQSFIKITITIKTDLQDCRVGFECYKCAVDFVLKLPN